MKKLKIVSMIVLFFLFLSYTFSYAVLSSKRLKDKQIGFSFKKYGYADPLDNLSNRYLNTYFTELVDYFGNLGHDKYKSLGIEIEASPGENVYSICDGKVTHSYYKPDYTGWEKYYNNFVTIQCRDQGIKFFVVYNHIKDIDVDTGDFVKKGQIIAKITPYLDRNGNRNAAKDNLFLAIVNSDDVDSTYSSIYWKHVSLGSEYVDDSRLQNVGFVDPIKFIIENPISSGDDEENNNDNNNDQGNQFNDDNQRDNNQDEPISNNNSEDNNNTSDNDNSDKEDFLDICDKGSKDCDTVESNYIIDGASSLIDYRYKYFGGVKDKLKLHPQNSGKIPVGVIQWLWNEKNCPYLKIYSNKSIKTTIKVKAWNEIKYTDTYRATISKTTPIFIGKPRNEKSLWLNIAIIPDTNPSSTVEINFECTKNIKSKNLKKIKDEKELIMYNGYTWTGTSSLISIAAKKLLNEYRRKNDFGILKDYLQTKKGKVIATVQWYKDPKMCEQIHIDFKGGDDSFEVESIEYKLWDSKDWKKYECNSLPCTVDIEDDGNNYYLLRIKGISIEENNKNNRLDIRCMLGK